jgi:hypothetical protein
MVYAIGEWPGKGIEGLQRRVALVVAARKPVRTDVASEITYTDSLFADLPVALQPDASVRFTDAVMSLSMNICQMNMEQFYRIRKDRALSGNVIRQAYHDYTTAYQRANMAQKQLTDPGYSNIKDFDTSRLKSELHAVNKALPKLSEILRPGKLMKTKVQSTLDTLTKSARDFYSEVITSGIQLDCPILLALPAASLAAEIAKASQVARALQLRSFSAGLTCLRIKLKITRAEQKLPSRLRNTSAIDASHVNLLASELAAETVAYVVRARFDFLVANMRLLGDALAMKMRHSTLPKLVQTLLRQYIDYSQTGLDSFTVNGDNEFQRAIAGGNLVEARARVNGYVSNFIESFTFAVRADETLSKLRSLLV